MEIKWIIIFAVSVLFAFFLGWIISKKIQKIKYDGQLIIGSVEDRDKFEFVFTTELEELRKQDKFVMQIVKSQNSQLL